MNNEQLQQFLDHLYVDVLRSVDHLPQLTTAEARDIAKAASDKAMEIVAGNEIDDEHGFFLTEGLL